MRSILGTALLATALAACTSRPVRPPSGCEELDSGCGTTRPPGITRPGVTPGGDGGVVTRDAMAGDASVDASGRVVLAAGIPRSATVATETPAVSWTVEPLVQPSGMVLSATTNDTGDFALEGVPVIESGFVLLARPPTGRAQLGALAEFSATAPTGAIYGLTETALANSLGATTITASNALAHIIIEVLSGGSRVAGVSASAPGSSANIAYDDAAGLMNTVDRTGPLGTVAVMNLEAPAAGGYANIDLSRTNAAGTVSTVRYQIFVMPGFISFVAASSPP